MKERLFVVCTFDLKIRTSMIIENQKMYLYRVLDLLTNDYIFIVIPDESFLNTSDKIKYFKALEYDDINNYYHTIVPFLPNDHLIIKTVYPEMFI